MEVSDRVRYECWPGHSSYVSTRTTLIQPSALIYMSVCGLLSRHCSSLSQPLSYSLSSILHPSLPGWLGCDLIKRTRGETESSGCSQGPRSALYVDWTTQWGEYCPSVITRKSVWLQSSLESRALPLSSFFNFYVGTEQLSVMILFLPGEAK